MSLSFWLTKEQFKTIQPLLPNKPRGVARVCDLPAAGRQAGLVRHYFLSSAGI